ncbi:MAG: hypothetical protein E7641_03830 [Ruminococcaceae bacterium]|nr:hypothetical protein [Oscillospiraceae bacterium]
MINEKYILESKNDTTDMTAAIEEKLREHGVCILGSGVFYVNRVNMPDGTAIMGMGKTTKVVLDPSAESGYAIRIGSFSTVKDIFVTGNADERIELPESVGERHGILFLGDATPKEWHGQPENSIVTNCFITAFTGGGLTCLDTGYYIRSSLTVSNCHILNCGAGINIPHFSEYHEFTNVLAAENLYGCINNGGNNVFTNCGFNSNETAFLIDNSEGQSPNDSHGSVIGCTFNHSGNNKGVGIKILGAKNGFVFSGCQSFYSKIILENSRNIIFNSFNFGKKTEISIKGGALTCFSDCAFFGMPTVTVEDNSAVRFRGCFNTEGEEIGI